MHSTSMLVLLAGAILSACTSSSSATGSACTSAGGRCVLGGVSCAEQAATGAQDCNPPPENPGGAFCCLDQDSTTCTWPASLNHPDAYTTACYAEPTYPICVTTDAGNQCGINACHTDEYAVFCGGPGPTASPPLPSGCRAAPSGPGGGNAGCCPCGS